MTMDDTYISLSQGHIAAGEKVLLSRIKLIMETVNYSWQRGVNLLAIF